MNSFVSGMVALGVVFSSYASEVFLSAFRAIPHGQYEGGYAIGLTNGQTMRLVVLPQLIRIALPGPRNLWLILLEGHRARLGHRPFRHICARPASPRASTREPFLFFSVASLIYLVLAIISSFGINAIERAVGQQERSAMTRRGRTTVERAPPAPPRGWPRERIAGYVLVGLWILAGIGTGRYLVRRLESRSCSSDRRRPILSGLGSR